MLNDVRIPALISHMGTSYMGLSPFSEAASWAGALCRRFTES
jgi:hypothetical protein